MNPLQPWANTGHHITKNVLSEHRKNQKRARNKGLTNDTNAQPSTKVEGLEATERQCNKTSETEYSRTHPTSQLGNQPATEEIFKPLPSIGMPPPLPTEHNEKYRNVHLSLLPQLLFPLWTFTYLPLCSTKSGNNGAISTAIIFAVVHRKVPSLVMQLPPLNTSI